ncbi:PEP/pyruvate-binding domain-containing protein [Serpentinicella alkaliphila]|uniref:Phosphoenolpyruvate synthase n=1 Tax=Serpentinicella alkaliphila TaxID=1734049 RepID=A0A4R2TIL1_9FIRM|nr:PEP/pyruvate-binding domain-containing protein [Serpentinicella alkaliphila]QUH24650.1 PEP/pyruvate-binding domain-containing protein [Serpentinicella alkaliphila]TCQ03091.1 pyruvate phosphate dikinase-like enzyme [Serpentinicella alkaliphila]
MSSDKRSTGIESLDKVLDYLRLGDNVVWQVDSVDDYIEFARPFVYEAINNGRRIVYMRFADHESIIRNNSSVITYELDAQDGFESFSTTVHNIIAREGLGVYYIFDSLSDLLSVWATDLMIGNFFYITCPFLFELDTIAYFAIIRDRHSYDLISRIRGTTQLLLDLYCYQTDIKTYYLHPLKVFKRYSYTMFLLHVLEHGNFIPIVNSIQSATLFCALQDRKLGSKQKYLDYWDKVYEKAEHIYNMSKNDGSDFLPEVKETTTLLSKMMLTKDARVLELVEKYFTLEDLIKIKSRLIGTGFVGGKSLGMLLARNIILKDKEFDWKTYLEPHDSFYIGSDVFYTYIVQNGWWRERVKQKTDEGYFEIAKDLREKMLKGTFPPAIKEQFIQMLEYFGQSPIIVRSSSLLEDGFGNAFAGKYESVFCVNQGSPEERYECFEKAVKIVYSSVLNEDALTYRLKRGLQHKDEQMALLVQRVSGSYNKKYFFPQMAGVGFSYNTYTWKNDINPDAGMLRLVFGLGTRAVDRVETDYPRIVSLDKPMLKTHSHKEDLRRFSQQDVDVLNIEENSIQTISVKKLIGQKLNMDMDLFGIRDHEINRKLREFGINDEEAWIITFDKLFTETPFVKIMRHILKIIEKVYEYPVDIEFAVNFTNRTPQINLLQCRPLQTKGKGVKVRFPQNISQDKIIVKTNGNFMGGSIDSNINKIIYVNPEGYSKLDNTKKYEIARIIGRLNKEYIDPNNDRVMLLGPGRWGTSTPSLGVPVTFSEISNVTILGEVAFSSGGLMPELSFGTHFFQDLVETDIFYIAIFPQTKGVLFNSNTFGKNHFSTVLPNFTQFQNIIGVYNFNDNIVRFRADLISQKVLCYLD